MISLLDIPARLALGVIFMSHGCRKLFGWFGGRDYQDIPPILEKLGAHNVRLLLRSVGALQWISGFLVFCGLWTCWGAGFIAAEVLLGIALTQLPNGLFLNWKSVPGRQHGMEYNLAIIALTLPLICAGAGPWSLDFARAMGIVP